MAFSSGLRAIGLASLVTITGLAALPAPAAASTVPSTSSAAHPAVASPSRGARVARIAIAQRGKRYARGATGPRAFDCSGLVRFAYRRAHAGGHLGGGHSARAMLRWGGRTTGRAARIPSWATS